MWEVGGIIFGSFPGPVSLFPPVSVTSDSTKSVTTALSTRRVTFTVHGKEWSAQKGLDRF